jgi:hypothetical protein
MSANQAVDRVGNQIHKGDFVMCRVESNSWLTKGQIVKVTDVRSPASISYQTMTSSESSIASDHVERVDLTFNARRELDIAWLQHKLSRIVSEQARLRERAASLMTEIEMVMRNDGDETAGS